MRLSAAEKEAIILTVKRSEISISSTLKRLGINKRTFYNWYHRYSQGGISALESRHPSRNVPQWNHIPEEVRDLVIEVALDSPELSPRELSTYMLDESGLFVSQSSVYRILRAAGLLERTEHEFIIAADAFHHKTQFPNEMWQTDFTYFKIVGWGWFYLSTVIDDYSRYVIHWELCSTMKREDVERSIDQAMAKAGLTKANPPKLLSDNGPCYIASELKDYLESEHGIRQIHGKALHPQTQGKIERYHRSMKCVVKLNNYYCPSELEKAIAAWVEYYNTKRYHESLNNLTPEDVYLGRGEQILEKRALLKELSIKTRIINNKILRNQN